MTRIILHPGFHKTGTTSLQRFLEINARLLDPHVRVILKPQMEDVAKAARNCSDTTGFRKIRRSAAFRRQFTLLLERAEVSPNQALLISCEALVGRMPGRDKVIAFDAATGLAEDMIKACEKHFGDALDLTLLYTTRDTDSWMQSAYGHLLHQSKFTLSQAEFAEKYHRAGDLTAVTDTIARIVPPHKFVVSKLENTAAKKFGPASDLLDLLNLPTDVMAQLEPAKQLNKKLTAFELEKMKTINARDGDEAELNLVKRRFIRKRRRRMRQRQNDTQK